VIHRRTAPIGVMVAAMMCAMGASVALGDQIFLKDGSVIVGQLQTVANGKITIKTDFAGDLTIESEKVQGITTDNPFSIELKTGDRTAGKLGYTPQGSQKIASETLGPINIQIDQVSTLWAKGGINPEVAAMRAALEKNPWSARIQFGLDGQSGNTERTAINGRAEINRKTKTDRLLLYAQGRSSRENGVDTVKEIIGGLKLEVDVSQQWFTFGSVEFEFDEFENIDLRTTISGGFGYFVIREPNEEFKLRGGLGFQQENFSTGDSQDEAVADMGWDYRKEIAPWLMFTHSVSFFPTFEDVEDYRFVMNNAGEIPLGNDQNWKLRLGVRNDYNSIPKSGVERLDTYYYVNILLDWK